MGTVKYVVKPKDERHDFPLEALEKALPKSVAVKFSEDTDALLETIFDTMVEEMKDAAKLEDKSQISTLRRKLAAATRSSTGSSLRPGNHKIVVQLRGESDSHELKLKLVGDTEEEEDESWMEKVQFGSTKLKNLCEGDDKIMKKIKSIVLNPGHTGHGETTALSEQFGMTVFHDHVENTNGLAFAWGSGGVLNVVAWGKKWNTAPEGNSKYKWTT